MSSRASALERIIAPAEGDLPAGLAEYLLRLHFAPEDHAKYEELSAKAQEGTLTPDERSDLEDLLTANDVLTILHAKARTSLDQRNPAA